MIDLTLCETSHETIEEVIDKEIKEKIDGHNIDSLEMISTIINLMPKKAKELKTLPKVIKEAINEYGYDKVEAVAIYMKKQKVEKIRAYFLKALKENWEIGTSENMNSDKNIETKIEIDKEKFKKISSSDILYEKYEKLEDEKKNEIQKIVYRNYIQKCGMETKIQKLAFMNSKKIHICKYLEDNTHVLESINNKNYKLDEVSNINISYEIENIKKIIMDTLELANIVFLHSEEEKKDLLKNILKSIIPFVISRELTLEKLNKIIKEHIEF